jgi:hypothetical protein
MSRYYDINIRGSTLEDITEEALHCAYAWLTRSLRQHRLEGKNGEYEAFAVGVMALLQKYQHLYTTPSGAPSPPPEY